MSTPEVVYLADHTLLLALPALIPAVIVAAVVIVVAVRDRRAGDPAGEDSGPAGEHGDMQR